MKTHALMLTLAAGLVLAGTAAAQTLDVTGSWDVSINTGQEVIPAQLALTKDGDKITGTIQDGRAPDRGKAPVQATLAEKKITIAFDYADQSGPMHIVMDGSVETDTMGGTITFGDRGQGEWSAKRGTAGKQPDKPAAAAATPAKAPDAKGAKADLTGTWNASVSTSEFSSSPTLVLKQDGEKVTGQYVSAQYGAFPLQGTLKGNAINLTFSMAIEGNSIGVTITGTADKDTINGNISYGGFADGTFAAKKKE